MKLLFECSELNGNKLTEDLNIEDEAKVEEYVRAIQDALEGLVKEKDSTVDQHIFSEKLILHTVNRLASVLGIFN